MRRICRREMLKNSVGLSSALLGISWAQSPDASTPSGGWRSFRMGFTPSPHLETPQAWNEMASFIRQNGDIVLQHLWGVPWTEALHNEPFHPNFMADWERRKALTAGGLHTYLAVTPLSGNRTDISEYTNEHENMPLPAEFQGKPLDDPMVKTAYLNYCERAIEYFQPEYAAIGIEVNSFYHPSRRKRWPEFVSLHHYVYGELKKKYPSLPLFATLDLHAMMASDNPDREGMLAGYKEIMDANDILAISFYPFFRGVSKRVDSSLAWLTETFDPYNKPYAVGETGESAENVVIKLKDGKHEYKGRPEAQEAYFEKLLALAQARRFKFIIAWFYRDPIAVERYHWEPWQHCGFLDENGAPRPAFAVWRKYFQMPLREQ